MSFSSKSSLNGMEVAHEARSRPLQVGLEFCQQRVLKIGCRGPSITVHHTLASEGSSTPSRGHCDSSECARVAAVSGTPGSIRPLSERRVLHCVNESPSETCHFGRPPSEILPQQPADTEFGR